MPDTKERINMKHIALTLLVALGLVLLFSGQTVWAGDKEKAQNTYERVMKSGKIRCGYIVWPPEFIKDVNTGEYSGLSYDLVTEAAKRLNLEVEWTAEVNFQTMTAGLDANHYDMLCFSLYRYTQQAKRLDFTTPLFYSGTGIYVRTDDNRFDNDLSAINSPDITLSTMDGEMSQFIAQDDFPNAKTVSLPQLADYSQLLMNVKTKKADVAFVNELVADNFMRSNPGVLKNIAKASPIRVFSHGFAFSKGEYDFGRMMDITLEEMQDHGIVDKILDKYDSDEKVYLRVAKPYRPQ